MAGNGAEAIHEGKTSDLLEIGGAEGDRTPDLYTASVALSQLSYGPECRHHPLEERWLGAGTYRRPRVVTSTT